MLYKMRAKKRTEQRKDKLNTTTSDNTDRSTTKLPICALQTVQRIKRICFSPELWHFQSRTVSADVCEGSPVQGAKTRYPTILRQPNPVQKNHALYIARYGKRAYQQVLRLDVSVTHTDAAMNVSQGAAYLISVQFVVLCNTIHSFRHVLQNQVQIQFVFIGSGEEAVLQSYDVWVVQQSHDLQLSILVSFILENLFDGHRLPSLDAFGLAPRVTAAVRNAVDSTRTIVTPPD
jgi:hypothetical protein